MLDSICNYITGYTLVLFDICQRQTFLFKVCDFCLFPLATNPIRTWTNPLELTPIKKEDKDENCMELPRLKELPAILMCNTHCHQLIQNSIYRMTSLLFSG